MNTLTLGTPLAIAGTGRRAGYRFFRHPRCHATLRALVAAGCALRGASLPPTAWDDLNRHIERSWKRHRRTRWHEGRE